MLDWGREVCGRPEVGESREWLCTNGLGGFASGTVAGTPTRRYHGLLVAALAPPLGRTLLAAKVDELLDADGDAVALGASRWADGTLDPQGFRHLERFHLEATTPVWTWAVGDRRLDKRVWMEPGANTTYVQYRLRRGGPARLTLRVFVNYRDYHGATHADDWTMRVTPVARGVRVLAFDGARPLTIGAVTTGAAPVVTPAHTWHRGFALARERLRGLDWQEDHLHAATVEATLPPGGALTLVLSAEAAPDLDADAARARRAAHDAGVLARARAARGGRPAPEWIERLALAADQFVVRCARAGADGMTVVAGYHWFGDWGRDTMIALPGLTLATGVPDVAARILRTFARFADRGMLPNRFPDDGQAPEYNTADAALWYVEAVRAYHEATGDDGLLKDLFPVLESIVTWHGDGTRHGIRMDPADGLLRAGEPGVQVTWMDAKVGDWVVTPRIGKPVEINALWYNALSAMAGLARRLRRPAAPWEALAGRAAAGFARFWNDAAGCCYDVLDGPDGDDARLRPNQIFAVSLPASPLSPARQRAVVAACARHLLTSYGLRSLAPGDPDYRGRYAGTVRERDGAYHQGTVWGWLLGPFALAHARAFGNPTAAREYLEPMAHHLEDGGVGTIAEVFDGDPPFTPGGCIAQAWSVAEILRAWHALGRGSGEPCEGSPPINGSPAVRPMTPPRARRRAGPSSDSARRGRGSSP